MGNIYLNSAVGLDYAEASVDLNQRSLNLPPPHQVHAGQVQPAILNITGIPAGAIIEQAFLWYIWQKDNIPLFWAGVTLTNPSTNSQVFSGSSIGNHTGTCWVGNEIWAFREDVTSIIDPSNPNGIYTINVLPVSASNDGSPDTDGATLMIIYHDPSASYTGNLVIEDGVIYMPPMAGMDNVPFPPAPEASTIAKGFVLISEAQAPNGPNEYNINGEPIVNISSSFWNFEEQITTILNGQNSSTTNMNSIGHPTPFGWQSDCLAMVATGIYYQTSGPAGIPTMGEWALIIFGLVVLILGIVGVYVMQQRKVRA